MPTPPLSDAVLDETVRVYQAGVARDALMTDIARDLGIAVPTLQWRLRKRQIPPRVPTRASKQRGATAMVGRNPEHYRERLPSQGRQVHLLSLNDPATRARVHDARAAGARKGQAMRDREQPGWRRDLYRGTLVQRTIGTAWAYVERYRGRPYPDPALGARAEKIVEILANAIEAHAIESETSRRKLRGTGSLRALSEAFAADHQRLLSALGVDRSGLVWKDRRRSDAAVFANVVTKLFAAKATTLPRARSTVIPRRRGSGRQSEQMIPAALRTPDDWTVGFLATAAVVQSLHRRGLALSRIGERFGWRIYPTPRAYCPMATAFLHVARRLCRSKSWTERWRKSRLTSLAYIERERISNSR